MYLSLKRKYVFLTITSHKNVISANPFEKLFREKIRFELDLKLNMLLDLENR